MRTLLSEDIKCILKNKKGFTLLSAMVYITLGVILTISLLSSISNVWSKFLLTQYQENFLTQKEQFFTMLNQDLNTLDHSSLKIVPSAKIPDLNKITFQNSTSLIEVIQSEGHLVYKRIDPTNPREIKAVDFSLITSSSFNKIDKVCVGEQSPSECFEVNNAIDIVLRSEKRIVRNPISYKSGRVIYYGDY